jgi:transcriptional regulator with PAS, ATPase and Fis domain
LNCKIIKRTGELGTSEELKRAVLDALPQHIIVTDQNGKVIESNQAWKSFVADQDRAVHAAESYEGARYRVALRSNRRT